MFYFYMPYRRRTSIFAYPSESRVESPTFMVGQACLQLTVLHWRQDSGVGGPGSKFYICVTLLKTFCISIAPYVKG